MTRIIPWSLPPVAGGSTGGYTPAPEPEPEPEQQYFDISALTFNNDGKFYATVTNGSQAMTVEAVGTQTPFTANRNKMSGIVAVNLVGVGSLRLILKGTSTFYNTITTEDYSFSLDPLNPNALAADNFISGSLNKNWTGAGTSIGEFTLTGATLIVYDGSGTIISTEEMVVE